MVPARDRYRRCLSVRVLALRGDQGRLQVRRYRAVGPGAAVHHRIGIGVRRHHPIRPRPARPNASPEPPVVAVPWRDARVRRAAVLVAPRAAAGSGRRMMHLSIPTLTLPDLAFIAVVLIAMHFAKRWVLLYALLVWPGTVL